MRLDIRYRTRFEFDAPVRESQNELRACPINDGTQQLLNYRVTVSPPVRTLSFIDYWGTQVDHFGVTEAHSTLEVIAEASVLTRDRTEGDHPKQKPENQHDPEFRDRHLEYLARTGHTDWCAKIAEQANRLAQDAQLDPWATVLAIHEFTGEYLSYQPGATEIGVPVSEIFAKGAGVCQDFAHLAVSMCRSVGIPARYVSGYLFSTDSQIIGDPGGNPDGSITGTPDQRGEPESEPETDPDSAGDLVRVQTHAWFEAAVPGRGWLPLDPTNRLAVGRRHVKIGHGRDYDDVPPLRGVYSGPGTPRMEASVEIRRMDPAQPPTARMQPLVSHAPGTQSKGNTAQSQTARSQTAQQQQ
ncbi:transglutaminase family protein [Candidatus Poriferisocius sp.]|uniref:transglutaminase family protein n=1 Tax=Candidatus Poriferisocius sp. TaxID=3101276 RepID=UPI003B5BA7B0